MAGSAEDAAARTAANKLYKGGLRQLAEQDYDAALATFDEVAAPQHDIVLSVEGLANRFQP